MGFSEKRQTGKKNAAEPPHFSDHKDTCERAQRFQAVEMAVRKTFTIHHPSESW
jgi:hypothetical protein